MSLSLNPFAVVIIGLISLGGLLWQFRLIAEDRRANVAPRRLRVSLWVSAIVVLGVFVHSILAWHDMGRPQVTIDVVAYWIFKSVIFAGLLCLKTYFGPLVLVYFLSAQTYYLFEYHTFHAIPIISALVDWLFEGAPRWLSIGYAFTTSLYILVLSVTDSVDIFDGVDS